MEIIRTVFIIAAQLKSEVFQLDANSSFLNGKLEDEVYVEQPQGNVVEDHKNKV